MTPTLETKTAGPATTSLTATHQAETHPNNDHRAVSVTFVSRSRSARPTTDVEEDSTDVYVLEKCSPLNDF